MCSVGISAVFSFPPVNMSGLFRDQTRSSLLFVFPFASLITQKTTDFSWKTTGILILVLIENNRCFAVSFSIELG